MAGVSQQRIGVRGFRALGIVHVVVGLLLLPMSTFFGLTLAPVLALGPLWVVFLGVRLWRPTALVKDLLWKTHVVVAVVAAALCVHGAFALRAAERSAAAGGGLLGAYGLIPLVLGTVLGVTAAVSLWLARPVKGARE